MALQRGPQGFYVWVIKPDSRAEQRPIEATTVGNVVVVRQGLSAGERVVINGQYRLQAGARVTSTAGNSPSEFADVIKAEIPVWAKIIKAAGARATD